MNVRYWNWIAAITLTVVLVAVAVPRSFLYSSEEWSLSLREHPWVDYLEIPLYLAGILTAALIVALLAAWVLRALGGTGAVSSIASAVLSGASIFGLSPLQPVFANIILVLLVPTLAESNLFPFESLRWIFTTSLVVLLGIALGAELALRVVESGASTWRDWWRASGQVTGRQAPVLAGRIAIIIMAGPLLLAAVSGLGPSPAQVAPEAQRFAFANEGIIVAAVFALFALALWLGSRWIGGRPEEPITDRPDPSPRRQAVTWSIVAVAVLLPLALLALADDPLVQRVDQVDAEPSAEHPFGTDSVGRDVMDRLIFAWRDSLYAGFAIGFVLFGLGVFWRLITPFNRSLVSLEAILERIPPGVVFLSLWAVITRGFEDAPGIQSVAIASGLILIPVALALIRKVDTRSLPAAGAALVMLGTLLVIGWSTVVGMTGLLGPPIPNFGEMLSQGRQMQVEAPWIVNYTSLTLVVAVLLPLVALTLLARCYGISRDLIRLRG